MRAETIPDIKKSPGGLLRPGSLERLARKSPLGQRLHQFGAIEQLRQLGDRLLGRSMFAGDVTGADRLRLEDRIDEDVVAHDLLEPIREVSIHDEELATSRFSMMRIMARWMNAATVLA